MALLCFSKKKNVAKRTWKRFTKKIRSKFRDLEIAASIRDSTYRLLRVISHRLIIPFKTRYLQNSISRTHFNNDYIYSHSHSHGRRQGSRFLEFFSRSFAKTKCIKRHNESNYWQICEYQSQRWRQGKINREEKILGRKKKKEEEEGPQEIVDSIEVAWRRVVAASPHLRVDERADEFIYKFREGMRMEKEISFLEFQERLKRSA
ncbi:hypothetical protein EUTSA_v10022185mg [Eutrema salsugineum]|uniref:Uncharacterized protein n=1 Tax=Eutrema salsugineum TaxID=72664 RepID=V4LAT6_EUTSA|nr:uncharacterized protein LOC18025058 [Eutrema salsugineum]ESQ47510.1 hypothetical protein EUTSA_v10022185mg [Eutrema salsugineum]